MHCEAERLLDRPRLSRRAFVQGTLATALLPVLASCTSARPPTNTVRPVTADRYPNPELLADPAWLAERLGDPNVRIVDLSPLADYERGHIPGAIHVWWQDLIEVNNVTYGMLVDPASRRRVLEGAGIDFQMPVVAYDNAGGRYAARFLWVLTYTDLAPGRLLNGGLEQWKAEGHPVTRDTPRVRPGRVPDNHPTNENVLHNGPDLLKKLGDTSVAIVDTRTLAEARENWQGLLRDGRIPNARSIPWDRNLAQKNTAIVRDPTELRRVYESQDVRSSEEIIIYGLTGVDAAHTFWMLKVLNYPNVKLYDGSWAQWGANLPQTPYPIEPLAVG